MPLWASAREMPWLVPRGRNEAGGKAGEPPGICESCWGTRCRPGSPRLEGEEAGLTVRPGIEESTAEGALRLAEHQVSVRTGGRMAAPAERRGTERVS